MPIFCSLFQEFRTQVFPFLSLDVYQSQKITIFLAPLTSWRVIQRKPKWNKNEMTKQQVLLSFLFPFSQTVRHLLAFQLLRIVLYWVYYVLYDDFLSHWSTGIIVTNLDWAITVYVSGLHIVYTAVWTYAVWTYRIPQPYGADAVRTCILRVRELRHREVKSLAQAHT